MSGSDEKRWAVTLRPHRSLSPRGFRWLMAVVTGCNLCVGLSLYAEGAWPATVFLGLDVALVYIALRANFAAARVSEKIAVTRHEVVVQRLAADQVTSEQRFARPWVRVELVEEEARELIGPLYLWFKGQRTEIGGFLPPEERQAFAAALQQQLRSA